MRVRLMMVLAAAWPVGAWAYAAGITGESGQFGASCSRCHCCGSAPTVQLSGPSVMDAGEQGQFTLTISGGPAVVGGLDVSVDNLGATLSPGPGEYAANGELTHLRPASFTNGVLTFTFGVTAPLQSGFTLYAAGNSCNGDNTNSGDQSATTVMPVQVVNAHVAKADGGQVDLPPTPTELGTVAGCGAGGAVLTPLGLCLFLCIPRRRRAPVSGP